MTTTRVAIISLPWSAMDRPSAALGSLAAYLGHHEPGVSVTTMHEYVRVAHELGGTLYETIALSAYELGEALYLPLLYPERSAHVAALAVEEFERDPLFQAPLNDSGSAQALAERTMSRLSAHLDAFAGEVSDRFDIVGLTTSFGQVFANVAFCQRLKRISPRTLTVLGGSSVSREVGPSLLREYPFIDLIVQGEGERPFLEIVRQYMRAGRVSSGPGILAREDAVARSAGAELSELRDLDELPLPNYDEYAARAAACGISWSLPVEGSRGCWWDRVKATGNAKNTCYFCNLNVQWRGYREKSVGRVVREVDELTTRYSNTSIFFLDNIIRHKGVEELAEGLAGLGKDLGIFYEMRANLRPRELVALWEAGVSRVQFGIEALSTSLLKRIGKGTTTIQNLEAMKTCFELRIDNGANLIVDFPTSTEAEVNETVHTIRNYAVCYAPPHLSRFYLGLGNTVETLPGEFGITNVRNSDTLRAGLPDDVYRRLQLLGLSYDSIGPRTNWDPVRAACQEWQRVHAGPDRCMLLKYQDGGTFLRIRDWREPKSDYVLKGAARKLYLYCCEIRSLGQIMSSFAPDSAARADKVRSALDQLVENRLMFTERGKYLSLATAQTPQAAAKRIRAAARAEDAANRKQRENKRLPVVPSPPSAS